MAEEDAASSDFPGDYVERTVLPGETDYADAAWQLKERIRRREGALDQRRSSFLALYRRGRDYLTFAVTDEGSGSADPDDPDPNDLVGFAVVRRDGYLSLLGVAPERRRSGVGSRLLERAFADHDGLTCHAKRTNRRALAFYADRGFHVVGRLERYYHDGTDAYRLARDPDRTGGPDRSP